jgi:pyocin large subunit-like protein
MTRASSEGSNYAKSSLSSQDSGPTIDRRTGQVSHQENAHFEPSKGTQMKDTKPKPETPPLTRAGRKAADATLAAAQFKPTSDGKRAVRQFEVHGIAVTEYVSATDAMPADSPPNKVPAPNLEVGSKMSKDPKSETAPLSRQGRKIADATLAAAKFKPTSDGKSAIRKFEVHGMAVTELVSADKAGDAGKKNQ